MNIQKRILSYLMKFPGQCFGAYTIDKALNLDQGGTPDGKHLSWKTHKLLQDMEKEGFVEQCYRKGFCIKQ